jgi:hypothetical protein
LIDTEHLPLFTRPSLFPKCFSGLFLVCHRF